MRGTIEEYFSRLRDGTKPLGASSPLIDSDLTDLLRSCTAHQHVGSRVTCNPAPTDTDDDILCLVDNRKSFTAHARSAGFTIGGSCPDDQFDFDRTTSQFTSLKRDDVNLIVTESEDFYELFSMATIVAKRKNLLHKHDRIELFQKILYSN